MSQDFSQEPIVAASSVPSIENVRVEGKYLVVPSGAVLPPFCVKTNTPVEQEDMQQLILGWCPPIVGLLILISGLLLIMVYFFVQKHCEITFGVSPAIQKKCRNRFVLKIVVAIVSFIALPFTAMNNLAIIVVLTLFIVAIVSLFIGNSPLSISKHRKGEFWISGCSEEFLSRICG